jgi:hypothetical protein
MKRKFILTLISLVLVFSLEAQKDTHAKEKIKFVSGITKYVRWGDIDKLGNSITIAVVRDKKMANRMEAHFSKRKLIGKRVKVEYYYLLDEIKDCDILYLSEKVYVTDGTINYINTLLEGKPVIILSNEAKRIAGINFYIRSYDNALCYEVNKTNLEKFGLIPQRALLKSKKTTKIE